MNERGELLLDEYEKLLNPRTKLVAVAHVSNALGTINPVARSSTWRTSTARWRWIDGAQAAPHMKVDVQALDGDFYAFSGHKLFGPTGIGILYGKTELLNAMPPYQGGGDMIRIGDVREDHLQRPALQIRSRHAEYRRRHRAGRGARLRQPNRNRSYSRPTSTSCWLMARLSWAFPACA